MIDWKSLTNSDLPCFANSTHLWRWNTFANVSLNEKYVGVNYVRSSRKLEFQRLSVIALYYCN